MKAAQDRNDELLKFDPQIFIADLERVRLEGVIGKWQSVPEVWLQPLRPALARAYSSLAKEMLLEASSLDDLEEALNHAIGAIAADPIEPTHSNLIAEIKEAREVLEMEGLSASEIAALKLPRVKNEPAALIRAGRSMEEKGKYKVARLFFGRAWELAQISGSYYDEITLDAQGWYAKTLSSLGHYAAAETEFCAILEILRGADNFGEEHPKTLATRANIAHQIGCRGDYSTAESEFRAVWKIQRRVDVLGDEHPDTLATRQNIARQIENRGDLPTAEAEYRALWEIQRRADVLGEEHPETLFTRVHIAGLVGCRGDFEKARIELQAVWEILRGEHVCGEEHPYTLAVRAYIARQIGNQGNFAASEAEYRAIWAIERRSDVLGDEHPETLTTRHNIAQQIGNRGDYVAAEAEFRAIWEIQRRSDVWGEEHPNHLRTRYWIAKMLHLQNLSDKAYVLLEGLKEEMHAHFHPEHYRIKDLNVLLEEVSKKAHTSETA